MSKAPPPLLGFNNNVRHQGRVFHIQTEDSGTRRARIITHLFVDGGRIVRTTRTDYSEHVGREDMVPVLRRLMKEQHKAMFIRLRSGALDDIIDQAGLPERRYVANAHALDFMRPRLAAPQYRRFARLHDDDPRIRFVLL